MKCPNKSCDNIVSDVESLTWEKWDDGKNTIKVYTCDLCGFCWYKENGKIILLTRIKPKTKNR